MARAKTREGAAIAYARGVKEWSPQISEHQLVRAFIDGVKWQKNRSNKLGDVSLDVPNGYAQARRDRPSGGSA